MTMTAITTESVLLEKIAALEKQLSECRSKIDFDYSMGDKYGVGTYGPNTAEEHAHQLRNYRLLCAGIVGVVYGSDMTVEAVNSLKGLFNKGRDLIGDRKEVDDYLFWI